MEVNNLFNKEIDSLTDNLQKREIFRKLSFKKDWNIFSVKDKKAYFVEDASVGFDEKSNDVFINKIKILIKKIPFLFQVIYHVIGASFVGTSSKKAIKNIPFGSVILNLGSGVTDLREDVINIDFFPFKNVDMVADIAHLPFTDQTADAVICEYVLEHVPDPTAIVAEIYRIAKSGALVYISVPFMASFHSAPVDFYRWSKMGLREELKNFPEIECKIRSGPGAAMDYALAEFFAILLSFGLRRLHQVLFVIFLILFAPLCWLDYIIAYFPTSENIAYGFYYIGRKT
jgi:SAM-dependent methyltransferase